MDKFKTQSRKSIAFVSTLLLCGGVGFAQMQRDSSAQSNQTPGQTQSQGMNAQMNGMQATGQASATDKMFVSKALQGGMAEVQLGQLTLQKSNNEQVKQFAQRMIDDHTKLGDQMKPVAQQIGVSAPTQLSKKDRKVMTSLQGLSGSAYDQAYIKDMIKDHKEDLSEFQTEASSGQDQTVKDAANQGSQVISQHLQMIQQIAKDQNASTTGQ